MTPQKGECNEVKRDRTFSIIPDEKAKGRDKSYNKAADKDIIEKKREKKKERRASRTYDLQILSTDLLRPK